MKKLLLILSFAFPVFAFAQSYNSPESVEYDVANNRWLVSSKGGNSIQQRSATGVISLFKNVTSPYGMQIVNDTVYVCSGSTIKGFSLIGANAGTNITCPGASFLNGLAADTSGNLYATDFSAPKIYKINIAGQYVTTFATLPASPSPNGIIHDPSSNRLVFVNWGSAAPIKAVSLADSSVTTLITTPYSSLDGIARDGAGNFYVSSWGSNSVYKYDNTFSTAAVAVVTTGLTQPADLYYAPSIDTLAIPNSISTGVNANTVRFIGFGAAPAISSTTIADSVLCYAQHYNVSYAIAGTFTAGNMFYAVLSDSSGSFANQDTIGSVSSLVAGTIDALIPSYTFASGTHFRIKVISTSPALSGPINSKNLFIGLCGGVSELKGETLDIFPNPATSSITISASGIQTIQVYDIRGTLVLTPDVKKDAKTKECDISSLAKGIYTVRVGTSKGILTKKIVVE